MFDRLTPDSVAERLSRVRLTGTTYATACVVGVVGVVVAIWQRWPELMLVAVWPAWCMGYLCGQTYVLREEVNRLRRGEW